MSKLLSIVVPVHNEEENIHPFCVVLNGILKNIAYDCEIIFVNDGSTDKTFEMIKEDIQKDSQIKIIDLSRNFGKELAITAGINNCQGDACITIDGDLQHPVEKIPEFIKKWEAGFEVVVGVRRKNQSIGFSKKLGSYFFYKIINQIADTAITPNASDFRLLDRIVIDEFNKFTEKNRMTRALIDWLGFKRSFVYFDANPRIHGLASYSFFKLTRLAFNSMVSFSLLFLKEIWSRII